MNGLWALVIFYVSGMSLVFGEVRISKFMTQNAGCLRDQRLKTPDWIELHNTGTERIDLGGYYLTDDASRLEQWPFPK